MPTVTAGALEALVQGILEGAGACARINTPDCCWSFTCRNVFASI